MSNPAKRSGPSLSLSRKSFRVLLIICLSFVMLSIPTRSTTRKNSPFAACFNALIRYVSGAAVIADEKRANSELLFLCPVKSPKAPPYIATTGFCSGLGKLYKASTFNSATSAFFCGHAIAPVLQLAVNTKRINRHFNLSTKIAFFTICI